MREYAVTFCGWYVLGVFSSIKKAKAYAKKMETDPEMLDYADILVSISDLLVVSDVTGQGI
jgi:hypothetical protein